MSDVKTVDLFGGAMRCSVPCAMQDVSAFRQVPDNQEVLNDLATGATLIVELLTRQREVRDDEAARFFYYDLAKANGCGPQTVQLQNTAVLPPSVIPNLASVGEPCAGGATEFHGQPCAYACLTAGIQKISKYTNEEGRENDIFVGLAVLRFTPPVSTEILVSLSCPDRVHPESSEAKVIERLLTPEEREGILLHVLQTLEVRDWKLFVLED